MKAAITAIISTVVLFIILVAMWLTFDTVLIQMNNTMNGTNYVSDTGLATINTFYETLRTVFTVCFVLSLCAIPIGYLIDAHRREHEEFQEYERYGPF